MLHVSQSRSNTEDTEPVSRLVHYADTLTHHIYEVKYEYIIIQTCQPKYLKIIIKINN